MDPYETLGLSSDASKAEIKEAFRRSALSFHPDRHTQSPDHVRHRASLRFKQASEAYQILIDDLRRADYDRARRRGHRGWDARPSSSACYSNPSSYGGGYGYGSGGGYRAPPRGGGIEFDLGNVFRYVTRRAFLMNVAIASALLGGAVVIERSMEAIWKMNNPGKSFEEAMESIEKVKVRKENS